ncbi:MAG: DUF2304 domain-containing protein [Candidatus Buchananbacteria bacterium CG10_big_fil_rev_8_21_14_0_10_42_9]|uniref:DUF2304 domain-containing protein n=1 Tax=Candidatus Buchananbacteria bacterium CG10_big_fil_rev_8_21_14_0_10_42_9 TaxID=1974526 RepID=A0A2H0W4I8_9BACT|nr:MAG: DUF2304 domain-containing protein [Candidatus Buchananbacteria bacterium CG10_big_fil_rev_8_21_14_0_10_42_9]
MIIKIVLLIFIAFALSRVVLRWRKKDITAREFFVWLVFWVLVAVAVILPQTTDVLAKFVGVSRGADLLVYISIVVLFFGMFKVLVKLESVDKQITELVRKLAIKDSDEQ